MTMCLHQVVSRAARLRPRQTALIEADTGVAMRYAELDNRIQQIARHIRHSGLRQGERAGILARNSIDFVVVYFAICRAGGIAVPLNYTRPAAEVVGYAIDCGLAALYIEEDLKGQYRAVMKKAKTIRFFIDPSVAYAPPVKLPALKNSQPASIIYTAGTARRPMGVLLSHRNLASNSRAVAGYLGLTRRSRACCVLPLYYIYGLSVLLSHFWARATVILENRFLYPNCVLDTIERYAATDFAGVSSHYAILLSHSDMKKRKLANLRLFTQAGDGISPALTQELLRLFPRKRLYLMYGLTEASPRLTYLAPALAAEKPASVGKAIPGVTVKIVDKRGKECRPMVEGQIIARGDSIMLGYWRSKKATRKVVRGGWLHTGDTGYMDPDGDLYVTGRLDSYVKSGGQRVNLQRIEKVVMEHGKILEAAAVDVPDVLLGRKIRLFVSPKNKRRLTAKGIMDFCRRRLAPYEVPGSIVITPGIPKNSFGKVDREALRKT